MSIHLHGTLTACPCGAETGITTVAFPQDYVEPEACRDCGKPVGTWGDTLPFRAAEVHDLGCREHPDTTRCDACGEVMTFGFAMDATGIYHFGCEPGAEIVRLS